MPRSLIAPSMLSSDFARLAEEAQRMVDAGADWLHMDVMVRGLRLGLCAQGCRPATKTVARRLASVAVGFT